MYGQQKNALEPWSNGLARRRKLKSWVYLRLCLAMPCAHLRWLAMTCAHFSRDQICRQVNASFYRLATQPKSTQVEWRPFVVIATYWPMKYRICLPWNGVFAISTCGYLLVRLATALFSELVSPQVEKLPWTHHEHSWFHCPQSECGIFSPRDKLKLLLIWDCNNRQMR